MRTLRPGLRLVCSLLALAPVFLAGAAGYAEGELQISLSDLEDKVRGAMAGQMVGVTYGDPTEFEARGTTYDGKLEWAPERVKGALDQDDLYVEMTFAGVMDKVGLDASTEQYGEAFRGTRYELWHANAAARRNLNNGIKAPLSGSPKYNMHANDIDFQIESDFIGLMTPGMPQLGIELCDRVGHVMNYGDGVYGGVFIACMYSAAYFQTDVRRVVEAGLACLPPGSGYRAAIEDVIAAHDQYPDDWKACWRVINEKWDKNESCPEGAFRTFNIDARLNGAYVAIGLLYGGGNFDKTIEIATRCGQDSDCNPSSACGILGAMYGYKKLDQKWVGALPSIADEDFSFTKYSFNSFVASTVSRAKEAVKRSGGKVLADRLEIPQGKVTPPPLEQWSMGIPTKVYAYDDAAWTWTGAWEARADHGYIEPACRMSFGGGNEATLQFEGNAIALVGLIPQRYGGMADIYLDGKKVDRVNTYVALNTTDKDVWHAYGLSDGSHTLRVVTLDEKDPRAKGQWIRIECAEVFRSE